MVTRLVTDAEKQNIFQTAQQGLESRTLRLALKHLI